MTARRAYHGIIRGKTIELTDSPGLPDNQKVQVVLEAIPNESDKSSPDYGLRRAFGAWADDADGLDEYLRWNREQRQATARRNSD